jgi:two-component system sensor histidine kinase CiaH
MFRSARLRLTAWFLAVIAACLLALGSAVYFVVAAQLERAVDDGVRLMAARMQTELFTSGDVDIRAINNQTPYDVALVVGPLQKVARDAAGLRLPHYPALQAALDDGADIRTVDTQLGEVRVYSLLIRRPGLPFTYVQVARSLEPEAQALDKLLRVLLLGGLGGLALVGIGAWFLAGKALDPVRRAFERQRAFVADASHELRTPLAVIRANAEYMQLEQPENREAGEIVAETDRLTHLVDSLLAVARGDRTELGARRVPLELGGVAAAAANAMRPLADARGVMLDVVRREEANVSGDEEQLRQLLVVLLDNALRYTGAGGHVDVVVGTAGGAACLAVKDTGTGIGAADLPHVFERFYRADAARNRDSGGTGLGLAIAQELVAAHGGTIEAESTPGEGSTFTVKLPLVAARTAVDVAPG